MENKTIIIIDVRDNDEMNKIRIVSNDKNKIILLCQSEDIKYNMNTIEYLSKDTPVLLVCHSGRRAKKVKDEYFLNNDNIKVLGGLNDVKNMKNIKLIYNSKL
jgi:rhodanese-related sulfurtransferase